MPHGDGTGPRGKGPMTGRRKNAAAHVTGKAVIKEGENVLSEEQAGSHPPVVSPPDDTVPSGGARMRHRCGK